MRYLPVILASFIIICMVVPASAERNDDPQTGKRLYKSFCLVCHGSDGASTGPLAEKLDLDPPDLTDKKYRSKSVDQMAFLIGSYGRPDYNAMPFLWKNELSESDIRNIAIYISVMNSSSISLQGDQKNGELIYMNSCLACHGPKGKGNGVLAKVIGAPKVGFTKGLSIIYLSDEKLISVIRSGKGDFMPAWGGILNNDEIIDTAAYVRSLSEWRSEGK